MDRGLSLTLVRVFALLVFFFLVILAYSERGLTYAASMVAIAIAIAAVIFIFFKRSRRP